MAGAIERGVLGADAYEDLLQQYNRGHRRNRAWFRSEGFKDAVLTRRGRMPRHLVAWGEEVGETPWRAGAAAYARCDEECRERVIGEHECTDICRRADAARRKA